MSIIKRYNSKYYRQMMDFQVMNQFYFMFDAHRGTEYQLSVCDALGKLIYHENFIALETIVQKTVNLSSIDRGYYTIQIVGSGYKKSSGILIDY